MPRNAECVYSAFKGDCWALYTTEWPSSLYIAFRLKQMFWPTLYLVWCDIYYKRVLHVLCDLAMHGYPTEQIVVSYLHNLICCNLQCSNLSLLMIIPSPFTLFLYPFFTISIFVLLQSVFVFFFPYKPSGDHINHLWFQQQECLVWSPLTKWFNQKLQWIL